MNHRAERLASEEELARRVEIRRALDGERRRARCKRPRCRTPIPPSRARHAVYCSPACERVARVEKIEPLLALVRQGRRAEAYPRDCPDCGGPMPPMPRLGRLPTRCRRCRKAASSRRCWRQKHDKPEVRC